MIAIKDGGRVFAVHAKDEYVLVKASQQPWRSFRDEEAARRWLSDNGLRKGRARDLLSAVLRNEGPFANPSHPKRLNP